MSAKVIINVMGTKEDVQKLFDTLCKPNEYGGTGIRLDRDSIRPVEGTAFPLWEAEGETDNTPKRAEEDDFKDLHANFSAVSIDLRIFWDDGSEVRYSGRNGHCGECGTTPKEHAEDEFYKSLYKILFNFKLDCLPETITMTEAMSLEAVKENGVALCDVPAEYKTVELCLEAVKKFGGALQFVPDELKTAELCLEAVRKKYSGFTFQFVPDRFKTAELCLIAVKQDGCALEYVPHELKTEELCLIAMKHHDEAFKFVPVELKTTELCLEAVRESGYALLYVPEELKTAELCLEAIKEFCWALEYVPDKLKTAEMCLEAVKETGGALEYIPDGLKTAEICQEAAKHDKEPISFSEIKKFTLSLFDRVRMRESL
jgi:hypothetical protein